METTRTDTQEWLAPVEAAALLGVKKDTLRIWRARRRGPAYSRHGNLYRYNRADIYAWLHAGRVVPGEEERGQA